MLCRYSPSLPMEEDEANHQAESGGTASGGSGSGTVATAAGSNDHQSVQNRPVKTSSVLGKAQAKKRLMAFSISKLAAAAQIAAKKQAHSKKENGDSSDAKLNASEETTITTTAAAGVTDNVEFGGNIFDDKHATKKKSTKKGESACFGITIR